MDFENLCPPRRGCASCSVLLCTLLFSTLGWCPCPLFPRAPSPSEFWLGAQNQWFPLAPCSLHHGSVPFPSSWQVAFPTNQLSPACNNCSLPGPFRTRGGGGSLLFISLDAPLSCLSSCHPAPTSTNRPFSKLPSVKPQECANCFLLGLDQCSY